MFHLLYNRYIKQYHHRIRDIVINKDIYIIPHMAKLVPFTQVEAILEQLIQSNTRALLLVTSEKN